MATSVRLIDWWGFIPRNGVFSLWFDEWRLLPMVRLMATSACVWWLATSAYGLMNGDFCLGFDWWRFLPWFDEWRRLPMVRLTATYAYGLIDDVCLWFDWWRLLPMVWLMASFACGLINGDFSLWFDWWRLLPVVWLMTTSVGGLINGVFCRCDLIDGVCCLWEWLIDGFFDWCVLSWEMTTSARFL